MSSLLPFVAEQLSVRVIAMFDGRLIAQAVAGAMLGLIDGLSDAERRRPPYLWSRVEGAGELGALLSKGGDAVKVLAFGVAIDATNQFVSSGAIDLGEAVVVALVICVAPYALLRSVVTALATDPTDDL